MKTKTIIKSLLMLAVAAMAGLGTAHAKDSSPTDQAALEAKAKVSKPDALKTALAKVPGTVEDSAIVQSGAAILWTFNITPTGSKGVTVVSVDATTGKIASVTAKAKGKKGKEDDDDDDEDEKGGKDKD